MIQIFPSTPWSQDKRSTARLHFMHKIVAQKVFTNDGRSQRKLSKWKGWFITLINSGDIFFTQRHFFPGLWLSLGTAGLCPLDLPAMRSQLFKRCYLQKPGDQCSLLRELCFGVRLHWGEVKTHVQSKRMLTLWIFYISYLKKKKNAAQTNVPRRALPLFISIRGVFSSALVQWRLPNQLNVHLPIHFRECSVLSVMDCTVAHH